VKTILLTALAVPFMLAIPVVAHADPSGPPSIFTPKQACDSTRSMVNLVHKTRPDAKTADQIVKVYDQILAQEGANLKTLYPNQESRDRFVQFTRDHMKSCNIQ
jgi:hypothetical protein